MDFFNKYAMGCVQMVCGFFFLARFLGKKIRLSFSILFAASALAVLWLLPDGAGAIVDLGAFALLLVAGGLLLCRTDWKSTVLYAVLVVELMQLCYGIVKSCLSVCDPLLAGFGYAAVGLVFMIVGELAALFLTGFCCYLVRRHFSYGTSLLREEAIQPHYLFLIFIPVLLIFLVEEYINSVIYGMVVTDNSGILVDTNHYQMLVMQLLGLASLFCVLFAYQKLLQGFRLSTELSLLEQEEHSLNQYVEEAKAHYEKTKSFRHDVKNHMAVIKKLLQEGRLEQALSYLGDMETMAEELSFPCSTNHPVVDVLLGNKLGMAKSQGIDVSCSLILPYPCGVRDIDLCIILSNALDNAIQACQKTEPDAGRYIRVSGRLQGDFLLMEIENRFSGKELPRKGTGLANIKAVTEKYQGAMSIKTEGTVFLLNVLLILRDNSDESFYSI